MKPSLLILLLFFDNKKDTEQKANTHCFSRINNYQGREMEYYSICFENSTLTGIYPYEDGIQNFILFIYFFNL